MAVNESNPKEILLGVFFNSGDDISQTLYTSFDGLTFRKIGEAYKNTNDGGNIPDYIVEWKRLRDPGLIYKDENFWILSGYDAMINNEKKFVPMWGYSNDLINWSNRASGSSENVSAYYKGSWPYSRNGEKNNKSFDSVAPDPFFGR